MISKKCFRLLVILLHLAKGKVKLLYNLLYRAKIPISGNVLAGINNF